MTSAQKNYKISTTLDSILLRNIPGFVIDKYNEKAITNLKKYIDREKGLYDINKGLCLIGNPGCGKTELMRAIQHCLIENKHPLAFNSKPVPDIASNYKASGEEALMRFRKGHWNLDELGRRDKEIVTYYHNELDIGDELVHIRYKLFRMGFLTHATTMFSKKELEESYDPSTFSRMLEMWNFVNLAGIDRRPTAIVKELVIEEEKKEVSLEEINKAEISNMQHYIVDQFDRFLNTDYTDFTNTTYIYDKLVKLKVLCLTEERKAEISKEAKAHVKTKNWSDGNFRAKWEVGGDESVKTKIINESKRIAVIQFYKELKECGIHIKDRLNEIFDEPKSKRVRSRNK